ncbi:hypothetical protein AB0H00_09520 [Nocardia sp. NPDC023852]|uniref:hypothetical protein n=1 Tax=Nocardia sp. NPDC023852 TaxID=3154697 RepID=UPI003407214C
MTEDLRHIHIESGALQLETNLVELAEDGALPAGRLRTRITEIQRERNKLQAELSQVIDSLDAGSEYINACLELLRGPYEMYNERATRSAGG